MRFFDYAITFREMPFSPTGSLTFFTGGQCKYNCEGCSWGETKPEGVEMSVDEFSNILKRKRRHTDSVCFLGEGSNQKDLIPYLKQAKGFGFTTMLYTGGELYDFDCDLLILLDYIKVGKWQGKTLFEDNTNQKVYNLVEGIVNREVFYGKWR